MKGSPIKAKVLSAKIIANTDIGLLQKLRLNTSERSIGIITTDCDDVSYVALDEATKKARVKVAYANSMYAGSTNSSTALAGEFIGILSGPNPEEVRSGLDAAIQFIKHDASFYSANKDDSIVYFAHCISRTGSYLSALANIQKGNRWHIWLHRSRSSVRFRCGIKSSACEIEVYYKPPTATNFGGGLLVGEQEACKAACEVLHVKFVELQSSHLCIEEDIMRLDKDLQSIQEVRNLIEKAKTAQAVFAEFGQQNRWYCGAMAMNAFKYSEDLAQWQ